VQSSGNGLAAEFLDLVTKVAGLGPAPSGFPRNRFVRDLSGNRDLGTGY
jgi:hypothetical protein